MFSDTEKGKKKNSKPSLRSNKSYLQSPHKVRSISATLTQFCSNWWLTKDGREENFINYF